MRNARGAISHGSLVQAQIRSCFIICAITATGGDGAQGENPFFSAKKKNTEHPDGYSVILANDPNFDTKT